MSVITSFTLEDSAGIERSFPSTRPALVCFIKEDCPTCRLVLPVLAAIHDSLATELDLFIIGQTSSGNSRLMSEFDPPFNLLDEERLSFSLALRSSLTLSLSLSNRVELGDNVPGL